jgi:hypothetical protein
MNTGNSVRDADPRCAVNADLSAVEALQEPVEALQEAGGPAVPGDGVPADEKPATRSRPPFQPVQDIQELIDKLAAVTRQLRDPGNS